MTAQNNHIINTHRMVSNPTRRFEDTCIKLMGDRYKPEHHIHTISCKTLSDYVDNWDGNKDEIRRILRKACIKYRKHLQEQGAYLKSWSEILFIVEETRQQPLSKPAQSTTGSKKPVSLSPQEPSGKCRIYEFLAKAWGASNHQRPASLMLKDIVFEETDNVLRINCPSTWFCDQIAQTIETDLRKYGEMHQINVILAVQDVERERYRLL